MALKTPHLALSFEAKVILLRDEKRFGGCVAAHVKRAFETHAVTGKSVYESTCPIGRDATLRMKTNAARNTTWVGLDWQTPGAK